MKDLYEVILAFVDDRRLRKRVIEGWTEDEWWCDMQTQFVKMGVEHVLQWAEVSVSHRYLAQEVASEVIERSYALPPDQSLTRVMRDAMQAFRRVIQEADPQLLDEIEERYRSDWRERPSRLIDPAFKQVVADALRTVVTADARDYLPAAEEGS